MRYPRVYHSRYVFHGRIPDPNKKREGGGEGEERERGEGRGEQGETRVN